MKAMQGLKAEVLRGCWYVAATASSLKRGKMIAKTMLGEPVVLVRGEDGKAFALRNLCPHRGIPLSYGTVEGASVRCCYHGWRFDRTGSCVEIPSLREGQQMDLGKIGCGAYPAIEQYGLIWVYFSAGGEAPEEGPMPDVDIFPHVRKETRPAAAIMQEFDCSVDHAAFGLMDPTHAAYVHTSWWFKKDARKLRPKEKSFEPAPFGWRMVRHRLPPQNLVYKLLGDEVTTEISYRLPAYRIEDVAGSKHSVVADHRADADRRRAHRGLPVLLFDDGAGALRASARRISDERLSRTGPGRRRAAARGPRLGAEADDDQRRRHAGPLVGAHQVRMAGRAQGQDRAFVNPLKPQTLRWRS